MMVLNDSLKLSARDNKDNDYQYSCAELILSMLADACDELSILEGQLFTLQSEKNTRH